METTYCFVSSVVGHLCNEDECQQIKTLYDDYELLDVELRDVRVEWQLDLNIKGFGFEQHGLWSFFLSLRRHII